MKKNNSSSIFFVTILLITLVSIFTTWGLQANAATMEKNLYTLENPTWMRNQGLSKGIDHDRQDLGVILPKNATIEIRQTNPNFKGDIRLELLNDDNQTESSYTVGNSWVEITASSDSVPFIKTTFTDDAPTVEYKVSDTAVNLPVFKQGDNENVFFDKWDATGATFGLVGNKYIQILVPVRDKFYLKKMDDFNSINALLAYYDTLFETFNELEGISFTPKNATDKNIPNRYFAKADKHGAGAAYYGGNYTAETSSSVISFWLKPGWGGLHEIAHGYQGNFMSDTTFNTGEVWNNLYADSMQKKMMGNAYYNGWLYEGNIAKRETTFEKSVYTTKTPVNNWDEASKLYMLTLMKDMAGDQAFTDFNQAYRADANTNNLNKDALILDLLTKYFGETSHYDFTAFVELVQGSMSDNQKVENLYSGNKAVYPLASLLSGNNLKTARKDINLDTKWGLVSNAQIDKYKLSATTEVTFSINDFAQIEGKVLRVKDGTDVVREVTITSPTVTLKNMPIGIYSLDIPTGITRFYEPSTNYLAVTDYESSAMIAMNEIQTSTFAENKMVFKGLGDSIFAIATVDPEKGNLELNVTSKRPHSYFENEYASIEVLDEQGNSAFKRVMDGNGTETGKFQVAIKPNYIIKIMHKEPSRFSIIGAPINLVHQATEQTFNVSKYGLTSDVTKVTDQDALVSYKSKLVSFAETVTANFKNEDYAAPKTKLKRGIDYLSDTDVDKIEYQQTYADLLALKNDISQDLLDGNQFRFQMNGLSDWNFANVRVNLDTNKAIITQNTGEPHWYFEGTYATVKINNAKGKEIFKKDFNGRGKVTASESNVIIAVGDFITLTHLESSGRLLITNEQTGKGYASYQTATYLVTASGLKKVDTAKIPTPNPDEFTAQNLQFDFKGLGDWDFATMVLDLQNKRANITQNAGEPHWYFSDTYASIQVRDARGKLIYTKKFNGRGNVPSSFDSLKIDQGYYITVLHQEYNARLLLMNPATNESFKTSKQATYKVTLDGLLLVEENSIPAPSLADIDGKLFEYQFLGLADKNFANLSLNLETMELIFAKSAGKPHVYFNQSTPYSSIQVKDQDGSEVYSHTMIGDEDATAVLKKIKLETGYYLIINHLEGTSRLLMAVDKVAQEKLANQNVYQISENGLTKKTLSDIPVPNRFTKMKIYGTNLDFTFAGLSDNQFAKLHFDKAKNMLHLDIKAVQPHYYFSDIYASVEVSDETGKVIYTRKFIGNVSPKAESFDIPIKEAYKIKITHQEPSRLVVTGSETDTKPTVRAENEFCVVANGLVGL